MEAKLGEFKFSFVVANKLRKIYVLALVIVIIIVILIMLIIV